MAAGTLSMVSSDHSPAPPADKLLDSGDFLRAWGGIASLQLSLPATWTQAAPRGLGLAQMAGQCPPPIARRPPPAARRTHRPEAHPRPFASQRAQRHLCGQLSQVFLWGGFLLGCFLGEQQTLTHMREGRGPWDKVT